MDHEENEMPELFKIPSPNAILAIELAIEAIEKKLAAFANKGKEV